MVEKSEDRPMATKLSETQRGELRQQLRQRFDELREEIRQELLMSDEEQYLDLAGGARDSGDESIADLLADLNLAVIDHHVNEFRAVEAAMIRIAKGTYGICVDCDCEIAPARLVAYPMALRCHQCQVRHEGAYPQSSHASL